MVQDTGLAQVQLEEEGIETVVPINRPAKVGERLLLRCVFTDVRGNLYRLEEDFRPQHETADQYLGEPGEADEDADEAIAAERGTE